MRRSLLSLAGLIGLVAVAALGMAALRNATEAWAGATALVTCGLLALGVVGAACRRGAARAWWLGYAIFGWGYLALAFWPRPQDRTTWPQLPTTRLLRALRPAIGPPRAAWLGPWTTPRPTAGPERDASDFAQGEPAYPPTVSPGVARIVPIQFTGVGWNFGPTSVDSFLQVGHCLLALLAAVLGGGLGLLVAAGGAERPPPGPDTRTDAGEGAPPPAREPRPPGRWRRTASIGLSGLGLATAVGLVVAGAASPTWAGVVFLLTCGLLGLAALGAALARGRRRARRLGAACFGWGYLLLAQAVGGAWRGGPLLGGPGPAPLLTTRLLEAARRHVPLPRHIVHDLDAGEAVLRAMERPIALRFDRELALGEALDAIRSATRGPGLPRGLPLHPDAIGINEAGMSLDSAVGPTRLPAVSAKLVLDLVLGPLDLDYAVLEGVVLITDRRRALALAWATDPFHQAGQCLFAVLAALLGGVAAPLVADTTPFGSSRRTAD